MDTTKQLSTLGRPDAWVKGALRAIARVLLLVVAGFGVLMLVLYFWLTEPSRPKYGWAKAKANEGSSIVERLEAYRKSKGHYPEGLGELSDFDGSADNRSEDVPRREQWRYARISDEDFELASALGRWVNTSDWIVYSPDHDYPTLWTDRSPYEKRYGGWLYFREGGSDRFLPTIDEWSK